ncbi:hypothetical protein [Deinococcus multiflagellatus]|uniref:DUF5071 domain-containing protein n=1 Tax=Deinococcus multiflagellatus TaxID=1656887 RepID=A0ABW1ZT78_9DEIO
MVAKLTQTKWGLADELDRLVHAGQRQRLAELLSAVVTEKDWTKQLQRWVETSSFVHTLPWLLEILMDTLAEDLTAQHAGERYYLVRLIITAAVDAAQGEGFWQLNLSEAGVAQQVA